MVGAQTFVALWKRNVVGGGPLPILRPPMGLPDGVAICRCLTRLWDDVSRAGNVNLSDMTGYALPDSSRGRFRTGFAATSRRVRCPPAPAVPGRA